MYIDGKIYFCCAAIDQKNEVEKAQRKISKPLDKCCCI